MDSTFVEVENHEGRSISVGEWLDRDTGYSALRIPREAFGPAVLNPLKTLPKDGSYFQLWLRSGYTTTPLRCEVARYDPDYRPRQPWVDHANDSVFDRGGSEVDFVGWLPLPEVVVEVDDPVFSFGGHDQWRCSSCGVANHPLRSKCRNCGGVTKK